MPRGNPNNLIKNSELTPEQLKKMTSNGGKKSGKVRREKKLMSQIYAEFLIQEHEVIGKDGIKQKLSGQALMRKVMSKVLARGDSSAVSMMREIREGTEGQKGNLLVSGDNNNPLKTIIEIKKIGNGKKDNDKPE